MNIIIVSPGGVSTGGGGKVALDSALALAQRPEIEKVVFFCAMPVDPIEQAAMSRTGVFFNSDQENIVKDKRRFSAALRRTIEFQSREKTIEILKEFLSMTLWSTFTLGWSYIKRPCQVSSEAWFKTIGTLHSYNSVCP